MSAFSKAPPRFIPQPPSDIPGPGSYDVQSDPLSANYKKGGMLEKAERWREGVVDPDGIVGPLGIAEGKENRPTGRTSSAVLTTDKLRSQLEDQKVRLSSLHSKEIDRLKATHQKEVERLSSTVTSREEKLLKAGKEREDSREELRLAREKLSRYTSQLPLLQTQLTELSTSNATSRAKKDAEITQLRSDFSKASRDLERSLRDFERIDKELREVKEREERGEEERGELGWRLGKLDILFARQKEDHELELKLLKEEIVDGKLRESTHHRQLLDRTSQIVALSSYATQLEEQLSLLSSSLEETMRDNDVLRGMWREAEESLVRRNLDEKEWRQRVRSMKREEESLVAEVARLEVGLIEEKNRSMQWMEETEREREEKENLDEELEEMKEDFEILEGELEVATTTEIPSLLSQISSLSSNLSSESDRASRTERMLRVLKGDYETLEGEKEEMKVSLEREKEGREREEGEARKWRKEREMGWVREGGLEEELRVMTKAFEELQGIKEEQSENLRTIDQLSRLNAAYSLESSELASLNTDLLSHTNSNQRIRHVAQIRQDLVESRKKHLEAMGELKVVLGENERLKNELESLKSVGAIGFGGGEEEGGVRRKLVRARVEELVKLPVMGTTTTTGAKRQLAVTFSNATTTHPIASTSTNLRHHSQSQPTKKTTHLSKSQPHLAWRMEENLSQIEDVFSEAGGDLEEDETMEVGGGGFRQSTVRKVGGGVMEGGVRVLAGAKRRERRDSEGGMKMEGRMRVEDLF